MKHYPKHMKISELSAYARIPAATIWYYARMGLLPTPLRSGRKKAYYTAEHLETLEQIRSLKEKGLSLAAIGEVVKGQFESWTTSLESDSIYTSKRDTIVKAAIELFCRKGYNTSTIKDIVVKAGSGHDTFYRYFKDKRELFLECADHVLYDIGKGYPSVRYEQDGLKRIWNRAHSFHHGHLHMIDMLNLARGVSAARDSRFEQMIEKVMQNLIAPIEADLLMASRQGQIHFKDIRTIAHLLMGASEYCYYYRQNHPDKDVDDYLVKAWDIILHGLSYDQGPEVTGGTRADGNLFKMSELSSRSGISTSTIRRYILEGLLPAAVKTGKTRSLYSNAHLQALAPIRHKQIVEGKPLSVMRIEIRNETFSKKDGEKADLSPAGKRDSILSTSTKLFFEKGYAKTSIDDIAQQGKMSKRTIYLHFKNKEEIFMACADRIFFHIWDEVSSEIKGETDLFLRSSKRMKAFFSSSYYTRWISMMNLVKGLSVGDNPSFKAKFHQVIMQIVVDPNMREIEALMQEGRFRKDIDSELASFILMGMARYGAQLASQGHDSAEDITSTITTIWNYGLLGHHVQ